MKKREKRNQEVLTNDQLTRTHQKGGYLREVIGGLCNRLFSPVSQFNNFISFTDDAFLRRFQQMIQIKLPNQEELAILIKKKLEANPQITRNLL